MSNPKGYSFGLKLRDNTSKAANTPGPLDYSTSSYSRFGKYTSPAFSIKSKSRTKENRMETPGPMDYQPLSSFTKLKPSRSYSFGFGDRVPFAAKVDTPPPNVYQLPTTIGNNVPDKKKTGRAYSMQGREKTKAATNITPGPGAYDPVNIHLYKKKEPTVPFIGRRQAPFSPSDPTIPGPSQYDTMSCKIDRIKGKAAPRAPFGIRHSPKKFTVFTYADLW